ncbi:hypothetical protein A1D22_00720 [Pasteurellaceae bacterium LFhippo2]|nr:hypothetical protein [Pasteurellaceae bacterium LFhippo2]
MSNLELLQQEFSQQKNNLEQESAIFKDLQAEQTKTKKILEALEGDLSSVIAKTKDGLIDASGLTVDEYVDLKNQTTGLKARIEYYKALLEEIEIKIYKPAEKVRIEVGKLQEIRKQICSVKAENSLTEFVNKNSELLTEIYTNFKFSGKFQVGNSNNTTIEEQILNHIKAKFADNINYIADIENGLSIQNPVASFEFRSPMQNHVLSFDKSPKGFERLINEVSQ